MHLAAILIHAPLTKDLKQRNDQGKIAPRNQRKSSILMQHCQAATVTDDICNRSILFERKDYFFCRRNSCLYFLVLVHVHCCDNNIVSSHCLLSPDRVAQLVEQRWCNSKVVGSIPTLVRVFLCPCVGPFPSVGLTLTWFIWGRYLALHITL